MATMTHRERMSQMGVGQVGVLEAVEREVAVTTHQAVLDWMACHASVFVRAAVAANLNARAATLAILALDSHSLVREAVARHPNSPLAVLSVFATAFRRSEVAQ